jgi:hypothetical protein
MTIGKIVQLTGGGMNRRTFIQGTAAAGAVLTASSAAVFEAGCSTSWINTVLADLPTVVGIANAILQVIATAMGNGVLASAVGAIISEAVQTLSASLQALQDAITAYQANTGSGLSKVISAVQAAQADAQKVISSLPAGSVSTVVQSIIIAGLGAIITILSSIQAMIPGAAPQSITAHATAAAASTTIVLPNAAAIKTGFNNVLLVHGYGAQEIK